MNTFSIQSAHETVHVCGFLVMKLIDQDLIHVLDWPFRIVSPFNYLEGSKKQSAHSNISDMSSGSGRPQKRFRASSHGTK